MNEPCTLTRERRRLALEASYEIEALSRLILSRCGSSVAPELRGMALRVQALASVVMVAVDGTGTDGPDEDAEETRELHGIVYGSDLPK